MKNLNQFIGLFLAIACASLVAAGMPMTTRLDLSSDTPAAIRVTPVAELWNREGFMPMRVRIENRGMKPLAWTFSFNVSASRANSALSHEVRMGAEPGTVFETIIFVPGGELPASGEQAYVSVRLTGPGAGGFSGPVLSGGSEEVVNTATVAALEAPLFTAVSGAPGVKAQVTVVDPAVWPADWRVWSPFARVVLDVRAYEALDGARRAALHEWVALGGALDIYPSEGLGEKVEASRQYGHGIIRRQERTLADEADPANKREIVIERSEVDALADSTASFISPLRREAMQLDRGAVGVPLFLIAFGLLIGPVNLFFLAPSGRRHRLFLTTPLISLGASLALVGYIVLKDGFGGDGARHGLVWLVPDANQAVVSQTQISRTGVLWGGGFALVDDVLFTRVDDEDFARGFNSGRPVDNYTRSGGRLSGDWFTSRRVQEHSLRALLPTRARVELVGEDGGAPVVQSSVGTVLSKFVYHDADGVRWVADEIRPGQRVTLRLPPDPFITSTPPGCFSARGGAAEGLAPIPSLASIRWDAPEFLFAGPLVDARTP